ncbi:unnamed protein product, partial [Vitis vinifera]|uniref:Uncharacterized protein n=1 Tax=Vitis vinifera TaxID=29760 RepID=D7U5U2_VITVI
MPIRYGWLEMA